MVYPSDERIREINRQIASLQAEKEQLDELNFEMKLALIMHQQDMKVSEGDIYHFNEEIVDGIHNWEMKYHKLYLEKAQEFTKRCRRLEINKDKDMLEAFEMASVLFNRRRTA